MIHQVWEMGCRYSLGEHVTERCTPYINTALAMQQLEERIRADHWPCPVLPNLAQNGQCGVVCVLDKSFNWVPRKPEMGMVRWPLGYRFRQNPFFEVTGPRHGQPRPLSTKSDTIVQARFRLRRQPWKVTADRVHRRSPQPKNKACAMGQPLNSPPSQVRLKTGSRLYQHPVHVFLTFPPAKI